MVGALWRTHGARITGCGASSTTSPRCAASCCTHHWQIFLPKERPGSWRPQRTQFAMESQLRWSLNKRVSAVWRLGRGLSEDLWSNYPRRAAKVSSPAVVRGFSSAYPVHRVTIVRKPPRLLSSDHYKFEDRRSRRPCADAEERA